ncbi:unnamed protein product, partial [Polarella glacialis]
MQQHIFGWAQHIRPYGPSVLLTALAMAAEDAEMHDVEAEQEEAKEPETAKELEADAPAGKVVLKAGQCCFLTDDTTLNVMPTVNGKLLMALSDGGFQYLLAGARASVGVK